MRSTALSTSPITASALTRTTRYPALRNAASRFASAFTRPAWYPPSTSTTTFTAGARKSTTYLLAAGLMSQAATRLTSYDFEHPVALS